MWGYLMYKSILSFVLLSAILFYIIAPGKNLNVFSDDVNYNNTFTVIVDAGHGGEDGGAVASDGTVEKDINLDIALKLEKILKMYGFKVIMTRNSDIMTCDENLSTQREKKISDIRNRAKIISSFPDSVFVSIHQNNFYDPTQKGTQVFYSKNNNKSKTLADCIQQSVVSAIQEHNKRLTKKSGSEIYLLHNSVCPAILVECGFLSNKNDLNLLKSDDYRRKIAILIADGIIKYKLNG